ncbi:hypothetical protein [Ornithinimicrobium cerasi]|uniref:hypothetical protein n=1 Tax=Ornithinimicrobium cerasi TaxID=2248773 RepID=UPI001143660C|nr:hypothetical protein [Ornithinimicrobium cerasi]
MRTGVLVLLLTAWMLPGCSLAPSGPAPGEVAEPLATRHTWGGMCPQGPCASTLEVAVDGRWTWEDGSGREQGRLGRAQLARLHRAVATTDLGGETEEAPRCDADADGTSEHYGWATADLWLSASSCEERIDQRDPLVRALADLADRLGG